MAHMCKSCGAVAEDAGHLCDPVVEKLSCSHCGESDVPANHVCKLKLAAMNYSCQSCGRLAAAEKELCQPVEIT